MCINGLYIYIYILYIYIHISIIKKSYSPFYHTLRSIWTSADHISTSFISTRKFEVSHPMHLLKMVPVKGIRNLPRHYGDVIMGAISSQITSLAIVYSTVYSDADQRKHQSSASLAFVRGLHRGPVNSPHKWPVTQKMFPFDDVIMRERVLMIYFLQC